jgi:hypothetical protein
MIKQELIDLIFKTHSGELSVSKCAQIITEQMTPITKNVDKQSSDRRNGRCDSNCNSCNDEYCYHHEDY